MISDAIRSFQSPMPYTVRRTQFGGYDSNGRVAAGVVTTFEIFAAITPLSGRELERLPEGLRASEVRSVFTITKLLALGSSEYLPDVVEIGIDEATGEPVPWQVEIVNDWTTNGGFYQAIVRKVADASFVGGGP